MKFQRKERNHTVLTAVLTIVLTVVFTAVLTGVLTYCSTYGTSVFLGSWWLVTGGWWLVAGTIFSVLIGPSGDKGVRRGC